MQEQIERREYNTKIPDWIKKLTKKRESRDRDLGGGEQTPKRHQFQQFEGRKTKVFNSQTFEGARLKDDEQLRMVFHPANVRNITKPKLKNGHKLCNRFHSVGFCFSDCRNVEGHKELEKEEVDSYVRYVQAARASRAAFQQRGNKGAQQPGGKEGSNESNPKENTTTGA